MADSNSTVQVVVQQRRPSSLKRRKPVNKLKERPSIKRSDNEMVQSSSEEEYYDSLTCNNGNMPSWELSDSEGESFCIMRGSRRRKTIPYEPGKLTPPVPPKCLRGKKRRSTEPHYRKTETIEKIKEETKLVVIEYLSSLSADELRARNRYVTKSKTIQFGEKPAVQVRQRSDSDLRRSASDAGSYRVEVRRKLQSMAVPLRRMRSVSPALLQDTQTFDRTELRANKKHSSLKLPLERITRHDGAELSAPSPETLAVRKLEWISQQILVDFPQLLDQPIDELSTLDKGTELSYEAFSAIARKPFDKQVSLLNGRGGIWGRAALTFYLVREVVMEEQVNDSQLELLVDYASKFVAENMYDWVTKSNSLRDLKLKEDILNATGSIFESIDSSDTDDPDGPYASEKPSWEQHPSLRTKVTTVVNDWVTYGVAALAVGIGIAYNYFKQ